MIIVPVPLARLTGTWGPLHRPSVWAHGYVQAFGFFALVVTGFACHAPPRFFQTPLCHSAVVRCTLWLQAGGVTAVATAWPEGWSLIALTAPPAVAAFVVFALNITMTIARPAANTRRPRADAPRRSLPNRLVRA